MIESAQLAAGLVEAGLIDDRRLAEAIGEQQRTGGDLRDILVGRGFIDEPALVRWIAKERLMRYVDPDEAEVDGELMAKIPRALIERHEMVALRGEHGILLALSDPDDFRAQDEVQFLSSRPVEGALAPRSAIRRVLERFYATPSLPAARALPSNGSPAPAPARPAPQPAPDPALRKLLALPHETLLRALVLALVEKGGLSADRILAHAEGSS